MQMESNPGPSRLWRSASSNYATACTRVDNNIEENLCVQRDLQYQDFGSACAFVIESSNILMMT
jgi:hypothetical protein